MKLLVLGCSMLVAVGTGLTPLVGAAAGEKAVMAKEEPRHRPKLENDYVRILDVEIPPGDQTLFHTHDLNYAFLMVNEAQLRNEVAGKPGTTDIKIPAGLVGYYRASEGAYTHRFINIGTDMFRAIGIELLRPAPSPAVSAPLPSSSGYVTVLDNERVRAYRLVLEPGQSAPAVTLQGSSVRVAGTAGKLLQQAPGGETAEIQLEPARFQWRATPSTHSLKNAGSSRVEIYEFELK
jgi:hypothetical protein